MGNGQLGTGLVGIICSEEWWKNGRRTVYFYKVCFA
jgi:hypothetical protein